MIGLAIGLFLVAASLVLFAGFSSETRRLQQEARLTQDLRAASERIVRDLRRAGHWSSAASAVWSPGDSMPQPSNPHTGFIGARCDAAQRPAPLPLPADELSAACFAIDRGLPRKSVEHGFEIRNGAVHAVIAGSARQPLTDPDSVTITRMLLVPQGLSVDARTLCATECTQDCPRVGVRAFRLLLEGHPPGDERIRRSVRSTVRVRNDHVDGRCPD